MIEVAFLSFSMSLLGLFGEVICRHRTDAPAYTTIKNDSNNSSRILSTRRLHNLARLRQVNDLAYY